MTPAEELHTAAEKLNSLITFLGDNRGPWYVDTPESGYPQSINNKGVPYLVAQTFEGPEIPVFTIAPYICAMNPRVGKALAKLFGDTADHMEYGSGALGHPVIDPVLDLARAINGTTDA